MTITIPGQTILMDTPSGIDPVWYDKLNALFASIAGYEAAWTPYTPIITASSGAFSTVSATGSYLVIGKLVHFNFSITITSIGTATGQILTTYPGDLAPRANAVAPVVDSASGVGGLAILLSSGAPLIILRYDGAGLIAAGRILLCTGIYEHR